ncbi:SDR family NAD(P)-dependent oxidoreductase [Litoreibacter roseus]|uniref:3-hydroxyacyl-CoA dehydrogenase n=1 Tax=Litoreibacter roseus TaxID=2601869 RepID=A0A6N6JHM3_9RHOB|nr:SDR family oxidoreductase [Litoreibacter roseus]GFE65756.1 3-hydroxyacyl-CoA dehydrogenase [Litoreibacter roseus]
MDLSGKHALVTGGGTGIGLAIATALKGVGADVTITGRRRDVLEDAAKTYDLNPIVMDVSDEHSVESGFASAVASKGVVDITVANAGIAEGGAIPKTSLEDWHRIIEINLTGTFLITRAALNARARTDWGRVIAISSIAGLRGLKGAAAYTASKHGMTGLMRGLAADYLGAPITFNSICPAYVDTAIVPQNIKRIMARTGMSEDEANQVVLGANPHGRLIEPSEVAQAALWLCGPGSESVNGQAIQISGGEF